MRQPFGGVIPNVLNLSACCMGRTLVESADSRLREICSLHCLDQLLNLLVQSSNICIRLCRPLIDLHRLDSCVVL